MDRSLSPLKRSEAIARGLESALAWVKAALKKAHGPGDLLNAFITLCEETALQKAAALDTLSNDERSRMLLCGMPIALKDNICYRAYPTTCGSRMLADFRSPYDATAVTLLERAGAIVIGKTNMDEFGMGSSSETSWYGPVKNPHFPKHTPGGSSGGSAAAVAAGIVPLALGSDTGGSVRQPAAFCGVYGLKPTYGSVSRHGLTAFCSSTEQISPIAADLETLELVYDTIAAPDPCDATSAPRSSRGEPISEDPARKLIVGMPEEYRQVDLDPDIAAALDEAVSAIREQGHTIKKVSLPHTEVSLAAYYLISSAEASANLARFDGMRYGHRPEGEEHYGPVIAQARTEGFGSEVKRRIILGTYALAAGYYEQWYAKAIAARRVISDEFNECFKGCDAILAPATPTLPFPIGEKVDDPMAMYSSDVFTVPASLAGIPALVVPGGKPGVGLQLMAARWQERTLFRAARELREGT